MANAADARSLGALNQRAAHPPELLRRSATATEGVALVLYIFRVPGREDLCLTANKPLGDVITDLDVSTALYFVRFDPSHTETTRMMLVRRNPAKNSSDEVALVVDPAAHIDVFAKDYSNIEPRYWRMNGMDVMSARSNFGVTVRQHDGQCHFMTPWTGRCSFVSVRSGHALRCAHTLRAFEGDENKTDVTVSELRFNFGRFGSKIKAGSILAANVEQLLAKERYRSSEGQSRFSNLFQARQSTDGSDITFRKSFLSHSSESNSPLDSDQGGPKAKLALLEKLKHAHLRSRTSEAYPFNSSTKPLQCPEELLGAKHDSLQQNSVSISEDSDQLPYSRRAHGGVMEEKVYSANPDQAPVRSVMGPRPMTHRAKDQVVESVPPPLPPRPAEDASCSTGLPSSNQSQPVSENKPLEISTSGLHKAPPSSISSTPTIKRKPVKSPSTPTVATGAPADSDTSTTAGTDDANYALQYHQHQLFSSGQVRNQELGCESHLITGAASTSQASSKMDLTLGREKLGGGHDGEQAKLGKLIVWDEGQQMLDLIVAANILMFIRAYKDSDGNPAKT